MLLFLFKKEVQMNKKCLAFVVFILSLAIQPSICFSELELQSEKMNVTGMEAGNDLGMNKNYKSITRNRFVTSKVLGPFLGFGIGHAIQGRWSEKGWIFTALELLTCYVIVRAIEIPPDNRQFITIRVAPVAMYFLIGTRIWQTLDLYTLPSDYKIVRESKLSVSPFYSYNSEFFNSNYGLSLSYKF